MAHRDSSLLDVAALKDDPVEPHSDSRHALRRILLHGIGARRAVRWVVVTGDRGLIWLPCVSAFSQVCPSFSLAARVPISRARRASAFRSSRTSDGETQLAFHGRPRDPVAVVGALWAAHREVVGTWIPFGQHLNVFDANAPVTSLLETGGGVLAAGPRALLQAYADVLQSHGLETRFLGTYRLGLGEPERPDVAVLLFGMSYVIGAGFSARRHNEPSPAA